jgi:hypothetical protein
MPTYVYLAEQNAAQTRIMLREITACFACFFMCETYKNCLLTKSFSLPILTTESVSRSRTSAKSNAAAGALYQENRHQENRQRNKRILGSTVDLSQVFFYSNRRHISAENSTLHSEHRINFLEIFKAVNGTQKFSMKLCHVSKIHILVAQSLF